MTYLLSVDGLSRNGLEEIAEVLEKAAKFAVYQVRFLDYCSYIAIKDKWLDEQKWTRLLSQLEALKDRDWTLVPHRTTAPGRCLNLSVTERERHICNKSPLF